MTTRNPRPGIVSLVNPDPQDARDREFVPADPSGPLPDRVSCDAYRRYVGTTWHQRGQECTGFALAAVANYTLRRRADDPALPGVSRRMLYEMAQFYDGEAFKEGSTLRGALKGWRRVGVTRDDLWPYSPRDEEGTEQGGLTLARLLDARARRLLRYERIATEDIRTMQHALAEGRALYASASYHVGWFRLYIPGVEPEIVQRPDDAMRGGHAFVIAGYDERGFWIHNSFGPGWGDGGYARLPYEDWHAGWPLALGDGRRNGAHPALPLPGTDLELVAAAPGRHRGWRLLAPGRDRRATWDPARGFHGPGDLPHLPRVGDLLLDGCLLGCMRVLAQDDLAEQADRTGPLAGSLLSLVAHRLASLKVEVADAPVAQAAEHAPRPEPILGLARDLLADPRLVSLGQDGRFEVTLLPGLTHLELPFDPEVQRLLVEGMLVPPPAPDQDLRDPLARALAALRSPQG
jgi:hypothetical protein